jgi:hypothetical protein
MLIDVTESASQIEQALSSSPALEFSSVVSERSRSFRPAACPRDRSTLRTLQLPEPNAPNIGAGWLRTPPEVNPSPRVEQALHAGRPRAVRPCKPRSFFTDVGSELTTRGLARVQASHLPPECDFRVRMQVQLIGGEAREIPGDAECHELALDLNGRRMAKLVLWVQSEQECYLCVTNRDSNGAVAALVPNPRLDCSKPFIVLANHPPARVPPERQAPARRLPSQQPTRSLSLTVRPPENRSKLDPRSATKSFAIGVTQGALYEVRHCCPLFLARWIWQ